MRNLKIYCFLFIYFFSCFTLVIDFHYCGGDLASVSLFHADESGCCGDEEGTIPGCCTDKLVIIDTDDNEAAQKYVIKNVDFVKCITFCPAVGNTLVDNQLVVEKTVIPINHAPPDILRSPIFIKNRVLLI